MRDLRIVFMGTPEFAVTILHEILERGYNVVGVITAPDKPAGRGRKVNESAVKIFADSHSLKVLQPTNLKSEEFLAELKMLRPNVQVVVAFRMLPKVVWQLPEYGTFNLHASLLPQYRGAAPINWAIINGEAVTGVSTFFIDEKIDTGEMILQRKVIIDPEDTAGSLHDKLMVAGARLVLDTLEQIRLGTIKTEKQEEKGILKEAPKLSKENTMINWNSSPETIINFIRGLNPYPVAWTNLENGKDKFQIKIYGAKASKESHNIETGKIVQEGKKLKVTIKEGFIELLEIQLPGKRKMKIQDLLNGYQFESNAKVL